MKTIPETIPDKSHLKIVDEYLGALQIAGQLSANYQANAAKIKNEVDRVLNDFFATDLKLVVNNKMLSNGHKAHFEEHAWKFLSQIGSYDVTTYEVFAAGSSSVIARYSFHTHTVGEIPCITIFRFNQGKIIEINEVFNIDPSIDI